MRGAHCLLSLSLAGWACSSQPDAALVSSAANASADVTALGSVAAVSSTLAPVPGSSSMPAASADAGPIANDPKLHPVLLAIAEQHGDFSRADGTYWSQLLCLAPPDDPSHLSSAAEGTAHGQKVFTLRLLDFDTYARETGGRPPPPDFARAGKGKPVPGAEQALVKVSYEPTLDPPKGRALGGIAPAVHQGKKYYPGEQKDLFVMYRPTDKSVTTDQGWLYGTVSPDGKRVSSAGLVKSCMGCHEKAPFGRQFGVK